MNRTIVAAVAALTVATFGTASAADLIFMKATGAQTGEIKGGVAAKGREGAIKVIEVHHEVSSPRDPASGQGVGKRQHKPFVIVKEIDRSTPLFQNALYVNETLSKVLIEFVSAGGVGSARMAAGPGGGAYYTVEMTNAQVASVKLDAVAPGQDRETIEFAYQSITTTWTNGNITAEDDWMTPVN